jgi:hypothetical protein
MRIDQHDLAGKPGAAQIAGDDRSSASALAVDPMTAIDRGSNSLSRLRTDIGPGDISSADAECGSLIDRNAGPTLGRTQARAGAAVYRTVHQQHDIGGGRNRASAAAIQLSMSMNASEHGKQCPAGRPSRRRGPSLPVQQPERSSNRQHVPAQIANRTPRPSRVRLIACLRHRGALF